MRHKHSARPVMVGDPVIPPKPIGQARLRSGGALMLLLMLAVVGLPACAPGTNSGTESGPVSNPVSNSGPDPDAGIQPGMDTQGIEDWRIEASRTYANRLQAELGARLKAALGAGGPVEAITVCQLEAPGIAQSIAAEGGPSYVGRTALRVRNPANVPDDEASAILAEFERELVPEARPPSRFISRTDGSARYMQAIPMQAMCIACHGSGLSTEVTEALAQSYPQDEATGFELGELRGAFLVEWPIAGAQAQ